MMRFLGSLVLGIIVGAVLGLFVGWVMFSQIANAPAEDAENQSFRNQLADFIISVFAVTDSSANYQLDTLAYRYKEEYLLMVAAGYWEDNDIQGAFERLKLLNVESVPQFVQDVAERYISNSRAIDDIYLLVALSESFGRLTPIMEPYRQASLPQQP